MQAIWAALTACFLAQAIKVIITAVSRKKWDLHAFIASGGMPSSHSSLTAAFTTSVAINEGVNSTFFAISLIFSLIVMYDSAGVRRSVGLQAKKLNNLLYEYEKNHHIDDKYLSERLSEILGHTPLEVFVGIILGIIVGLFF